MIIINMWFDFSNYISNNVISSAYIKHFIIIFCDQNVVTDTRSHEKPGVTHKKKFLWLKKNVWIKQICALLYEQRKVSLI